MNNLTRFFLVVLRLALGWLILVEGLDKIRAPNWSSVNPLCDASAMPVKSPESSTTVREPKPIRSNCSTTSWR